MLTNAAGARRYGSHLGTKGWRLCLLSRWPLHATLRAALRQLLALLRHPPPHAAPAGAAAAARVRGEREGGAFSAAPQPPCGLLKIRASFDGQAGFHAAAAQLLELPSPDCLPNGLEFGLGGAPGLALPPIRCAAAGARHLWYGQWGLSHLPSQCMRRAASP